jgi:dTDP-4-dehydrorhamnose 3,5-epimerase
MRVTPAPMDGLLLIEPDHFSDSRGVFLESWQRERYGGAGVADDFVQDNYSRSVKNTLRGLHFQVRRPQAQLITVTRGRVFDVTVDLRSGSPSFGRWFGTVLSEDGPHQLYMPPGFAHGFCVLSDGADLHYKVSRFYDPHDEGGLSWRDPDIAIEWPVAAPLVSVRDSGFPHLRDMTPSQLPHLGRGGR